MKAALDFLYEGVASKAIITTVSFLFLVYALVRRAHGHSFFRLKKTGHVSKPVENADKLCISKSECNDVEKEESVQEQKVPQLV